MKHQVRAAAPQAVALARDGQQVVHECRPIARVVKARDLGEHQRQKHRKLRGQRVSGYRMKDLGLQGKHTLGGGRDKCMLREVSVLEAPLLTPSKLASNDDNIS